MDYIEAGVEFSYPVLVLEYNLSTNFGVLVLETFSTRLVLVFKCLSTRNSHKNLVECSTVEYIIAMQVASSSKRYKLFFAVFFFSKEKCFIKKVGCWLSKNLFENNQLLFLTINCYH